MGGNKVNQIDSVHLHREGSLFESFPAIIIEPHLDLMFDTHKNFTVQQNRKL